MLSISRLTYFPLSISNADSLDEDFTSLDDHMSKIGAKEFTPREIRDAVPGIDWGEVARLYVVGRTPEECRTRYAPHMNWSSCIESIPGLRRFRFKLLR